MRASLEVLQENYAQKETSELLQLRANQELTDFALEVLGAELDKRGVTEETIHQVLMEANLETISSVCLENMAAPVYLRFFATFVDFFMVFALSFLAFTLAFEYLEVTRESYKVFDLWFSALSGLYLLFKDGWGGRSLGKRIFNLIVIDLSEKKPCGFLKSLVRNLFLLLTLVDGLFALSKDRKRLGDWVAGTQVVHTRSKDLMDKDISVS